MELFVQLAWLALAVIHFTPALPIFIPKMIPKMYGVEPSGPFALLLTHRSGLFLAVFACAIFAAINKDARAASLLVITISMLSFLWLYVRAGSPAGALRKIAVADAIGLPFLALAAANVFGLVR